MNEFVFPDPPRLSVDLVPSVNRGGAVPAVSDLLQLGTPQVNRLTDLPSWIDDKDTRQFLLANQGQCSYHLVCLLCDFTPRKNDRIDEAWVTVTLARSDNGSPLPVARSMDPVRLPFNRKTTQSSKLTSDLHIIGGEYGGEVEVNQQLLSIVGHPTPESSPYWKLKDLVEHPLEGPEYLKLLVQLPAGVQGSGTVKVEATVRQQKFLLPDRFVPNVQDPSMVTFLLS
jgi:hypothetical protein